MEHFVEKSRTLPSCSRKFNLNFPTCIVHGATWHTRANMYVRIMSENCETGWQIWEKINVEKWLIDSYGTRNETHIFRIESFSLDGGVFIFWTFITRNRFLAALRTLPQTNVRTHAIGNIWFVSGFDSHFLSCAGVHWHDSVVVAYFIIACSVEFSLSEWKVGK